MKITRLGLNGISYEMSREELAKCNLDLEDIKKNENILSCMKQVSEIAMQMLGPHINPIAAAVRLPIKFDMEIQEESVKIMLQVYGAPFEVLDFDEDYDEEVDIEVQDGKINILEHTEEQQIILNTAPEENTKCISMLGFTTMSETIEYAEACQGIMNRPDTMLYKADKYYLVFNMSDENEKDISKYENMACEWYANVVHDTAQILHIKECGSVIIKEKALETLSGITHKNEQ